MKIAYLHTKILNNLKLSLIGSWHTVYAVCKLYYVSFLTKTSAVTSSEFNALSMPGLKLVQLSALVWTTDSANTQLQCKHRTSIVFCNISTEVRIK